MNIQTIIDQLIINGCSQCYCHTSQQLLFIFRQLWFSRLHDGNSRHTALFQTLAQIFVISTVATSSRGQDRWKVCSPESAYQGVVTVIDLSYIKRPQIVACSCLIYGFYFHETSLLTERIVFVLTRALGMSSVCVPICLFA